MFKKQNKKELLWMTKMNEIIQRLVVVLVSITVFIVVPYYISVVMYAMKINPLGDAFFFHEDVSDKTFLIWLAGILIIAVAVGTVLVLGSIIKWIIKGDE